MRLFLSLLLLFSLNVYSENFQKKALILKKYNLRTIKKHINKNNVNLKDKNGETFLTYALIKGDIKKIKFLLNLGADPNIISSVKYNIIGDSIVKTESKHGDNPFILAIKKNKPELVKLLLKYGAKVNIDNASNTPLNVALKERNKEIVELLINHGADLNPSYESWNTPLIVALSTKDKEIIELLISKGADVNKPNFNDVTPLEYSFGIYESGKKFDEKRFEIVKFLINKGAKFRDETLYNAIRTNYDKLIAYLIEKGARLNQNENLKYKEFVLAVKLKNINILKELLKLNNSKEVINISLFHASGVRNNKFTVDFLLNLNANVNYVDKRTGKTPLINAIESDDFETVRLLVEKGANVNFVTKYGLTPLMSSVNNLRITEYLVKNGAEINLYNPSFNKTLLSYAIIMGKNNNEVIKFLIEKKAVKKHALYYAALTYNKEIIKYLLSKKVDINQKYKGVTPLTAAIRYALYSSEKFNKNQKIKDTISLLISNGGKIDKALFDSEDFKNNKKIYDFVINELKKL